MKKQLLIISLAVITALSFSCKKEEPAPTPAPSQAKIVFVHKAGPNNVEFKKMNNYNKAGNNYWVEVLKYYVTNITFTTVDGQKYTYPKSYLINGLQTTTTNTYSIDLTDFKFGKFAKMEFLLGVDSVNNHTGAQEGDLDPSKGMLWTWKTGYIFFKVEGSFRTAGGATKPYRNHLGLDENAAKVSVNLSDMEWSAADKSLNIVFDMNAAFGAVETVDLNGDFDRQTMYPADLIWAYNLKTNLAKSFTSIGLK